MGADRVITRWRGAGMILAAALVVSLAGCGNAGSPARAARAAGPEAGPGGSLHAGQTGPRSAVPWARVGPGWVLGQYWPGRFGGTAKPVAAAVTLYLIDPAGGRYRRFLRVMIIACSRDRAVALG
jgi:hypothetical protein